MGIRIWLANMISGGELSRVTRRCDAVVRAMDIERKERRASDARTLAVIERLENIIYTSDANQQQADHALRDIIAMQTPGANATVRRMVKRAKEGLGE